MSTEPHDMIDSSWTSDCCGASAYLDVHVEPDGKTATGICSDCKEHCGFTREQDNE